MGLIGDGRSGALNVAIFISLSRFDHHDGMRLQRIGDSPRRGSITTVVKLLRDHLSKRKP
jgi:hypothetical protein